METVKYMLRLIMVLSIVLWFCRAGAVLAAEYRPDLSRGADNFYKSGSVVMKKVTFQNIYKMKVAGDLFTPKNLDLRIRHAAIIVGHPFGAVKEQAANLYAQKLAEQGFVTLTFDLSYWGESEGEPRSAVAPDIYADDYSAAADFLGTLNFVDKDKIGVVGICAGGGFALSAAKIDPRLRAVATVSMVDMGSAARMVRDQAQRLGVLKGAAAQRELEVSGGAVQYTGGTPEKIDENSDAFSKEFYDFYRTKRGACANTNTQPTLSSNVKFMNFYPFSDLAAVSPRPLLFIAGANAISRGFSEAAYSQAAEPKELYIVPGAGHVDLYDRTQVIPFGKLASFFSKYLR